MSNTNEQKGYEATDASISGIIITACVLVVIVLAGFFAGKVMLDMYVEMPAATKFESSPMAGTHQEWTTSARLQVDLREDFAEHSATTETPLDEYGVISEQPEVYHFPIDEAMDYVVAHGFPKFVAQDARTQH